MAELTISKDDVVGIKKEIDEGAYGLVFQALQEDIYSYPIKSFIRETISNGLDAITERDIAVAISKGDPVNKYYRDQHDGMLLKDSDYDPSYYNMKYLNNDKHVYVHYKVGEDRDSISVTDNGVGIAGSRLKGFFKIGYSTRRNMKDVFGKFGMGAKAGLSTGVEYFIMTTTYNGYSTSFMIYKHDYEPITEKSLPGFEEEWEVMMANGKRAKKIIYWEASDKDNNVVITLPVKKANREAFLTAVRQQFSYFRGKVHLRAPYRHVSGYSYETLDSIPLYESDTLMIPDSSPYSAPHIVVDNINYGIINWGELELENRQGKIGIKVHANEVDITQSRESLKWTDKTKAVILDRLKTAKIEASEHITSLVKITGDDVDLFTRITSAQQISRSSQNPVALAFSKFLDTVSIIPKITIPGIARDGEDYTPYLTEDNFKVIFYHYTLWTVSASTTRGNIHIGRTKITDFSELNGVLVYAKSATLGDRKTMAILDMHDVSSFIYIRDRSRENMPIVGHNVGSVDLGKYVKEQVAKHTMILDDMKFDFSEEKESEEETTVPASRFKESLASIRRRNKETLYMEYDLNLITVRYNRYSDDTQEYVKQRIKTTLKISDLENEFPRGTIVTTKEHADLATFIEFVNHNLRTHHKIIYVAKDALKYFLPYCTYITQYLKTYNAETKTIMIGDAFKDMNTLSKVKELNQQYPIYAKHRKLLKSLVSFDVDKYFKIISTGSSTTIKEELKKCYSDDKIVDTVLEYLEKLAHVQDIIKTESPEEIASQSKKMLGGEILHVKAYDEEFYNEIKIELDRLLPIAPILNEVKSDLSNSTEFTNLVNRIIPLIN